MVPDRKEDDVRAQLQEGRSDGCGYKVRAGSEEELRTKVVEHARKKHGVKNMTDTIYNYLRNTAAR